MGWLIFSGLTVHAFLETTTFAMVSSRCLLKCERGRNGGELFLDPATQCRSLPCIGSAPYLSDRVRP